MRPLLKKYFIITTSLYLVIQLVPALTISQGWQGLFSASLILSLLLTIARPIVNFILLPINLLTLNLSTWLVNIALIYLWTLISPNVSVSSWQFAGGNFGFASFSSIYFASWQAIIIIGIVVTSLIQFLNWILK